MSAAVLCAWVAGVLAVQFAAALPDAHALAALVVAAAVPIAAGAWLRSGVAHGSRRRAGATLLVLGAALAGAAWAASLASARLADALGAADEGRDLAVVGVIDSLPARGERSWRFEFQIEQVLDAGAQVPGRVWLAWFDAPAPPQPGQRWAFTVRLKQPHGPFNPHGFDLEAWMLERDLRATGAVRPSPAPRLLEAFVLRPGTLIERVRAALRDRLAALTEGWRYGGVLIALVLGDQRAISAADWSVFNRSGIAHLVAISGLHITMIAGLAALLAAGLWRRVPALLARAPAQSAAALAAVLTALAYCLLAGWGVPAQRTFFMLATVAGALLLRVWPAPSTTLAAAAAVVCTLDPWAVIAPGFWLSFGAVGAIFWVASRRRVPPAAGWHARLRHALGVALRVQLAVTLVLVPLSAAFFHQVSLVSPLANALAIPVVSWGVTPLALLGAALAWLPGPGAAVPHALLAAAEAIFAALMLVVSALADARWAAWPVAAPPWPVLLLGLAGALWCLAPRGWPARPLGLLWLGTLFVWPPQRPAPGEVWVSGLDVGQGAAVLVESADSAWLYDTGPRHTRDTDAGERIVLPWLRARGITRLDGLVVSHLDVDHSGGAAAILRGLPVDRVLSSVPADSPLLAGAAGVERCEAGQRWAQGGMEFAVLHPRAADYGAGLGTNALSCVLAVRAGAWRLLLTGDLPAREEAALAARAPLAADWVMAPHHGSRHSSSPALIAAAGPRWVLVQAGYRNRYGHPAPEVEARWRAAGAQVVRSDAAGLAQWRLGADGTATLSLSRRERARYWHHQLPLAPVPAAELAPAAEEAAEPLPEEILPPA
jgi:competence protein ComEC